jgi:hypothetical protein
VASRSPTPCAGALVGLSKVFGTLGALVEVSKIFESIGSDVVVSGEASTGEASTGGNVITVNPLS